MKYGIVILLLLSISSTIKAQQTPRDEYTVFAKFKDWASFVDYVAENVKKPASYTADAKGTLTITVLVDSMGKASVFKIQKKILPEVDAAFENAILAAPNWTPANFHGKPVPIYFTISWGIDVNKAAATMLIDPNIGKIFNAVQVQPSFPGGEKAYGDFLSSNIKYPSEAKKRNVTGRVFIQFIVEKDGSLTDLKILRDPGYGLGDEAIRVMKLSPNWVPGMQNGKTVRVQFTVPINFSLQ